MKCNHYLFEDKYIYVGSKLTEFEILMISYKHGKLIKEWIA